jgi:hypothetical protein
MQDEALTLLAQIDYLAGNASATTFICHFGK